MNLLGLSATIPNINAFASWLQTIHHKEIKTVIENDRPVPLHIFFQCHDRITDKIDAAYHPGRPNRLDTLIERLESQGGLPAIYFAFSRRKTEDLAYELRGRRFLTPEEETRITELFGSLCRKYGLQDNASAKNILPLVRRGIAFHHAGMLPTLKEVVEQLFTSHLLKLIFTTETFALGINMPSRSVVFDDLRKIYGRYAATSKQGISTRWPAAPAARHGQRRIRLLPHPSCQDEVRRGSAHRLWTAGRSQKPVNTSYATLLNLFGQLGIDSWTSTALVSLLMVRARNEQKEAARLLAAKMSLLKELGFIHENALTDKGNFAKAIYGYELIISELYDKHILQSLDVASLGMLAVAAVFEPRKYQQPPARLPQGCRQIKQSSDKLHEGLRAKEQRYRIYPVSKKLWWHLSPAMEAWMKGEDFGRVATLTDTDEGEIVRYFRMGLQILNEMRDIKNLPAEIKEKVEQAIRLINRDEVDAEKQLREE
jgi:superfamily II RNA helicase